MRRSSELWKVRARALAAACRALRRGEAEALHDLRVALRRAAAVARALGREGTARRARRLARSLSRERQLEVDRLLLAKVAEIGALSPEASAALAARWDDLAARGKRRVERAAGGRRMRSVLRRLGRLSRKKSKDAVAGLDRAWRRVETVLERPLDGRDDRALHVYRMAARRARYLAEDLAALGLREFAPRAERARLLQDRLGRWNDLRLFVRRLAGEQDEAARRGAVTLSAELGHLVSALSPVLATVREEAVEASRASENVVPITKAARA